MIFSELYSAYYNAVAKILSKVIEEDITEKDLQNIIESTAFAESSLTILPAIRNGKWQVINEDLTTPILNAPTMPLTTLQKRWLKSLSLDPRIRLFDISFDGLDDVEPLFTPDDYVVYDRYLDGDPYFDEAYIRNFKTILEAIKNKTPLKIEILNRLHQPVTLNTLPIRLEYSEKDDKFRMISKGCKYGGTINIARITNIEKYNGSAITLTREKQTEYKVVTLKVYDQRNTLERSMLHFAHFEKQVEKLDEETYMVHIKYDKDDETELVIRVLSFGPMVEVIEPDGFRNLIIERLKKQKTLI